MTLINLSKKHLPLYTRVSGGWLKTITGLNKDYPNGYSLQGKFLSRNRGKINFHPDELYLDCSIEGTKQNPTKHYHLFTLNHGEIQVLQTIEDGQWDWAKQLWETIELWLQNHKTTSKQITTKNLEKLDIETQNNEKLISYLMGFHSNDLLEFQTLVGEVISMRIELEQE